MATDLARAAVLGLFEAYFDRVYGFVRRSADPATAEEITQEVFLRLLSSAGIERKQVSVSYLIKIAHNLLKRRHHRQQRGRRILTLLSQERHGQHDTGPTGTGRADALTAFDRLAPHEQDAVRLIVCEGLSYRDAAESLGVTVAAVNNWKHRGLERLRRECGGDRRETGGGAGRAADASRTRHGQAKGAGEVDRGDARARQSTKL